MQYLNFMLAAKEMEDKLKEDVSTISVAIAITIDKKIFAPYFFRQESQYVCFYVFSTRNSPIMSQLLKIESKRSDSWRLLNWRKTV